MSFCLATLACLLLFFSAFTPVHSQEQERPPHVFLDCNSCDFSHIRRQIPFVNWVRDREEALVHVLITARRTASGGREYGLDYIGLKEFQDTDNTLQYISPQHYTDDERRNGLVGILKIGLLPYLTNTPLLSRFSIFYAADEAAAAPKQLEDSWDSWVFEIEGSGALEKETSRTEFAFDGQLSANRITEEWRIRMRFWGEFEEDRFKSGDQTIKSQQHEQQFWGQAINSLGPHWSVGVLARIFSNTFDNMDLGVRLAPALEYSFFEYAESDRRSLTLGYYLGHRYHNYTVRTIFNEVSEPLFDQSLDLDLRLTRPWGSARVSVEGSHFFHDLQRYRVEIFGRLSLRIHKGLSLNLSGSFDRINDQLSLEGGDATLEEILLQRRNLATDYQIDARVGLSYTFGSIYNNVVNTRL